MKNENKNEHKLSDRQLSVISFIIANPEYPYTVVSEQTGVPYSTLNRWKAQPEFKEELQKRLRERWEEAEGLAQETMMSLCREGDFKAAKYILDSMGYNAVKKVEVSGNLPIVIENDLD